MNKILLEKYIKNSLLFENKQKKKFFKTSHAISAALLSLITAFTYKAKDYEKVIEKPSKSAVVTKLDKKEKKQKSSEYFDSTNNVTDLAYFSGSNHDGSYIESFQDNGVIYTAVIKDGDVIDIIDEILIDEDIIEDVSTIYADMDKKLSLPSSMKKISFDYTDPNQYTLSNFLKSKDKVLSMSNESLKYLIEDIENTLLTGELDSELENNVSIFYQYVNLVNGLTEFKALVSAAEENEEVIDQKSLNFLSDFQSRVDNYFEVYKEFIK